MISGGFMHIERLRARRAALRLALAVICGAVITVPWSDSGAQTSPAYSIDLHVISAAGKRVRTSCFILNGTAAQAAPGYSSGGGYSVLAGFWPAAALAAQDEIFFDSFERC
jgi:hypothetical protein